MLARPGSARRLSAPSIVIDPAHAPPPASAEPAGPVRLRRRRGDLAARRWRPFVDLVWTIVRTDFKARYHGTLGGFVWALLKPLTMFLSLLAIFSFVFSTEPNYRINLLIGLFLWEFFSESTRVGVVSLAQKAFLLTKAKFPGWIAVVTSVSNPLITLAGPLGRDPRLPRARRHRLPGAANLCALRPLSDPLRPDGDRHLARRPARSFSATATSTRSGTSSPRPDSS